MFAGSSLSAITFNKDSTLNTIGAQAFNECQLSSISIPQRDGLNTKSRLRLHRF